MPVKAGLKDESVDNLVFGYDIGDTDLSYDGYPVENSVSKNAVLYRYNNPGFSGYNIKTDRIHPDTNTPIWELAFYPQDEGRVPRLTSTEGYGCYHGMNRNLYSGTVYLASIMMKEGPGTRFIDNDMNHGYSNIGGWNTNGTTKTKEYVGNGWWRFYTIWNNQTTAYSADGVTPLATRYNGNTYTTYELTSGENIVSTEINMVHYTPGGQANYKGTYNITSSIQDDYGGVGATMVDWGLDEAMTKPVFDPVFNYPDYQGTRRIFYKINMPTAGSVRMRTYHYAAMTYLADSKYWKIRFSDTALNKRELMWVTAPMIHEIPSTAYKKPWQYVDGVREGGLRSFVNNIELDLSTVTKSAIEEGFEFDGTDDYIGIDTITFGNGNWTLEAVVYAEGNSYNIMSNTSGGPVTNAFGFYGNKIYYQNYDGAWQSNYGNTTLSLNTYYHFVWVNSNNQMKMYVNGVKDSIWFNSYTTNGGPCNAIGRNWFSFFNGRLPLIKHYTNSLTNKEIEDKFNAIKGRFNIE